MFTFAYVSCSDCTYVAHICTVCDNTYNVIVSFCSGFIYTKRSNRLYELSISSVVYEAFWQNREETIALKPNDRAVYIRI